MDPHYRVTIFGSARIKEGDTEYKNVYNIAKGLAESGFDIITGGGPGIMQAANAGHKSAVSDAHSIGLNIKLPFEQRENKYLDIKKEFDRFSSRLDTFMALSDVVIVAPGGIGTLLEFFYTWQLIQVQHICETPVILYGEIWAGLLHWLKSDVLEKNFFGAKDMHHVFHIKSAEMVINLVKNIHEDRSRLEHVCVNYDKYRVDFN